MDLNNTAKNTCRTFYLSNDPSQINSMYEGVPKNNWNFVKKTIYLIFVTKQLLHL